MRLGLQQGVVGNDGGKVFMPVGLQGVERGRFFVLGIFRPKMPIKRQKTLDRALMDQLSNQLDGILSSLPRGGRIIYLDVPLYFNVGDLLINLGTERFFARSGISPVLRYTFFDICRLVDATAGQVQLKPSFIEVMRRTPVDIPIVFQGGGNLGDLYPDLQGMREAVIRACPDRQIVILPQSIHFDDEAKQRRSLECMVGHSNVTIFLRDAPSLEAVRAISPAHGILMPDMAHALWPELSSSRVKHLNDACLTMRRRDNEVAQAHTARAKPFDWDDIITSYDTWSWRAIRKAMHWGVDPSHRLPLSLWYVIRDRVITRAVEHFGRHGTIDTDRLHGMLLGCLTGRRVKYADNRYGKLSRYASEWLNGSPLVCPST